MLVKGGSAGLDGGIDGRQERDLGDERVTERRLKKLAQKMALCNAMIGLGKALARQFVGEPLHPVLHGDGVGANGLADMAVKRPELDIQRETRTGRGRRTARLRERWWRLTAGDARARPSGGHAEGRVSGSGHERDAVIDTALLGCIQKIQEYFQGDFVVGMSEGGALNSD